MTVILPIKTVSEMNTRTHWAARHTRLSQHRRTARVMVGKHPLPCVVTMVRMSPGTLDDDNLRSALKGTRDGIADALGVQDNDPGIQWRYEQEKVSRGTYGVRVEVSPA